MSWIAWIWNNIAPNTRANRTFPARRTAQQAVAEWKQKHEMFESTLPLQSLDALRQVAPYYTVVEPPPDDAWWNWAECEIR